MGSVSDVTLPAVARPQSGFAETWYARTRDGTLIAHKGDCWTENAEWMLAYDLRDIQTTVHEDRPSGEVPARLVEAQA